MRYNINACVIYNSADGTLTLPCGTSPEAQLSTTTNALLSFFLHHTGVVSREEVLKKVWDDNGLTSSNANLNQYLSMLRKTLRCYDIEHAILTISRGNLQLNPDLRIEKIDPDPAPITQESQPAEAPPHPPEQIVSSFGTHQNGICWYMASAALLLIALLLLALTLVGKEKLRPISLTPIPHSHCELLASDEMLRSVAESAYGKNFDAVRQRLKLECKLGERFVFFYGDRLETNGLGRVFLAHCAMHEDNPFSYCDNYFYYSWKPQ
ncbi:helix-turn-helix domain-containing protein [Enterobacter sp. Cy-643]|uniref:winged helix-turn-helix domain-containing protein n=1 Tax=Enterobacter sp. Cy-643 TaxID=2608346 RepID=UPI00141E041C|nr:winged helix-turn-helix domain-containing protein [Enterobacter sp. Cy-643]NIF30790.1 helix-turn-helix domain-containing protein [Enterobacter sp. Cy-643]